MIVFLSDFGLKGPYVGQVQAVLQTLAPAVPQMSLMHDLPAYDIESSAYLLPALLRDMPDNAVYLCVVDPGVGGQRSAVALRIEERWLVGPDNGLFDQLASTAEKVQWFEVTWLPRDLSHSFHGRDLFAPVAAAIALGEGDRYLTPCLPKVAKYNARELRKIIYIDQFGNAMTGMSAKDIDRSQRFQVAGVVLQYACTFSDVMLGEAFWYENALGLLEFSVNQGSAEQQLGLNVGMSFNDH